MPASRWKNFRDSLGHLTALVALVGGCLVVSSELWPRLDRWHQQRLADEIAGRVESLPDGQVKIPLHQLAAVGTPALGHLVEFAASQRDEVARLAQHEIDIAFSAALMQLRENATAQPIEALIALSAALADNVANFGPTGQRWVEGLTLRMIEVSDRLPTDRAATLLATTNRTLEGVPPRSPRTGNAAFAMPAPPPQSPPPVDLATLAQPSVRVLTTPGIQEALAQPLTSALPDTGEDDTPIPASEEPWSPAWLGIKTISPPPPPPPLTGDASLSVKVRERSASQPLDVPTPTEFNEHLAKLRRVPTEELLKHISTADKFAAGAIRTVLTERGVDATEAETAARIRSADEGERLRLVEEASQLPAASARRLLRLLVKDSSGEVRLRALTTLATTNDPELPNLVRTIAVEDKDPRVADLATKLLRQ